MSGHRTVNELLRPIMEDPARRARVEDEKRVMDAILTLHELRARMGATEEELAQALEVSDVSSSTTGHKDSLFISAISAYVEALGGRLDVSAVFPDQTIDLGPIGVDAGAERPRGDSPGEERRYA